MADTATTRDRALVLSEQLSPGEQLRLITLVSERLRHTVAGQEPMDLLSLAGRGADLWRRIDVDAYLRQERESWQRQARIHSACD